MTSVDDDQGGFTYAFAPIKGGVEEGIYEGDDEKEENSPAISKDMTQLPEAYLPQITGAEAKGSEDIHTRIRRCSRHSVGTSLGEEA